MVEVKLRPTVTESVEKLWNQGYSDALMTHNSSKRTGLKRIQSVIKLNKLYSSGRGLLAQGELVHPHQLTHADNQIIIYYPRTEHTELFAQSARRLILETYASAIPGSVGFLRYYKDPETGGFEIKQVHGCFRTASPETLTQDILEEYKGWRKGLLAHIFRKAQIENVNTITCNITGTKTTGALAREFTKAAENYGYTIEETTNPSSENGLILLLKAIRKT